MVWKLELCANGRDFEKTIIGFRASNWEFDNINERSSLFFRLFQKTEKATIDERVIASWEYKSQSFVTRVN